MKFNLTFFSKNAGKSAAVIAMLGLIVFVSACKKDSFQSYQPISALSITNASPTTGPLDFVLNGRQVNYSGLVFGGDKTTYFTLLPGTYNGIVKATNTTKSLYSGNFNLTDGQYQSLFILSKGDSISYLVVKDVFTDLTPGKAKIRFANLSSDSPSYNLEFQGDTTTFSDRTYKTFTQFKDIAPKKYTLLLKDKVTSAVVATATDIDIAAGNYYTIWAKGLVTTTVPAQKLSIQVNIHK